jgi:ssDNA-binding replication factor A large subunit
VINLSFIKIKDLEPVKKPGINIRFRVIVKSEPRSVKTKYGLSRVCDVIVSDETGHVTLSLWGNTINDVKFGDLIELTNGYCNVWQNKPQISIGRDGEMKIIEDDSFPSAKDLLAKYAQETGQEE